MLSFIVSPLQVVQSREALLVYLPINFVCYQDNSWKTQPIWTKFSHTTFDWNSSAKFEMGIACHM